MRNLNLEFKARLKRLGLTQRQFADLVGLQFKSVRNALSCSQMPRWRELEWGKILDEYEARQREQAGEGN